MLRVLLVAHRRAAHLGAPPNLCCALSVAARGARFEKPPQRDPVSRPRPTRAGGPLTSPSLAAATRGAAPVVPANAALADAHPSLRVIGAGGENLGVMPSAEGLSRARDAGLDLVLVNGAATPPVARIASLVELRKKQRAAEKDKRRADGEAARRSKMKEVRLTARTAPHDLAQKVSRVADFLRAGHPVQVSLRFSEGSAAAREEPARREALEAVARAVAEGGFGFCDASSVAGGKTLQALFTPTKAAKPAALWEPLWALLKKPSVRRAAGEEEGGGGGGGGDGGGAGAPPPPPPQPLRQALPPPPAAPQTLFQQTRGAYTGKYAGFVPAAALAAAKSPAPPPPLTTAIVPGAKTLMRRFASPDAGVTVAKLKVSSKSSSLKAALDSDDGDLGGGDDEDGSAGRSGGRRRGRR
jgi:translation initiation factor IF-3